MEERERDNRSVGERHNVVFEALFTCKLVSRLSEHSGDILCPSFEQALLDDRPSLQGSSCRQEDTQTGSHSGGIMVIAPCSVDQLLDARHGRRVPLQDLGARDDIFV